MRYERPHSMTDAVGLLAGSRGTAAILAGGSDLLVRMKGGFVEPDLIVDIKAIDGLSEIRETADGFSIGAAVSCAVLGESAALTKSGVSYPRTVPTATRRAVAAMQPGGAPKYSRALSGNRRAPRFR